MKSKILFTLAILFCLCLFSASSKECIKPMKEKDVVEIVDAKTTTVKKNENKEMPRSEFSFILSIFFQTT